jgi:hypothetical protein
MRLTKGTIVLAKMGFMMIVAGAGPFIGLLKPLQTSGDWPNGIAWAVTFIFALVAIANVGIAFTSASFAEWMDERKEEPPKETKP